MTKLYEGYVYEKSNFWIFYNYFCIFSILQRIFLTLSGQQIWVILHWGVRKRFEVEHFTCIHRHILILSDCMGPNSNGYFAGWLRPLVGYIFEDKTIKLVIRHPSTDNYIPCLATHWSVQDDIKPSITNLTLMPDGMMAEKLLQMIMFTQMSF